MTIVFRDQVYGASRRHIKSDIKVSDDGVDIPTVDLPLNADYKRGYYEYP